MTALLTELARNIAWSALGFMAGWSVTQYRDVVDAAAKSMRRFR